MEKENEYIASFSGGKDSAATIILAHENNEPLDLIIFAEVMFDHDTSGELPEHIRFIENKCKPLFESWGYEVKVLRAKKHSWTASIMLSQRDHVRGSGLASLWLGSAALTEIAKLE